MRLSDKHLKRLAKIRKCGDFSDDSAALRWCIDFTKTMLSVIPAAVAETYISSFTEDEGTTVAPDAPPSQDEPFVPDSQEFHSTDSGPEISALD